MERAIVGALGETGHHGAARARPRARDYTGVWVEDRKIASIGVHLSRGVSAHGFAVNVDNDLAPFTWVVACGLPSVSHDLGRAGGLARRPGLLPQADGPLVRAARSAAASGS